MLTMVLTHATSPSFTYFHAWDAGDVVVWDAVRKSNCRGASLNAGLDAIDASCPGEKVGARFFFDFEAIRTASGSGSGRDW